MEAGHFEARTVCVRLPGFQSSGQRDSAKKRLPSVCSLAKTVKADVQRGGASWALEFVIVVLDCAVSHHELHQCQTPVPTDLIIDPGSAGRSVKADGGFWGRGGI